jgi:hypothetical protein
MSGFQPLELHLIKEFQQTDARFFSSEALRSFANGGPPPQLPPGTTQSERRGRAMFDNVPFDGVTTRGICNMCHSGPMLNRFAPGNPFGPPGGFRADIGVSDRNLLGNPVYTFIVTNQDGSVVVVSNTPDPGAMLNDPPPGAPPGVPTPPRFFFANLFKVPTLWGVKDTGSVLSRQLGEDARGCRGALRLLLLDQSKNPGLRVHAAGSGRHRGIPQAAPLSITPDAVPANRRREWLPSS